MWLVSLEVEDNFRGSTKVDLDEILLKGCLRSKLGEDQERLTRDLVLPFAILAHWVLWWFVSLRCEIQPFSCLFLLCLNILILSQPVLGLGYVRVRAWEEGISIMFFTFFLVFALSVIVLSWLVHHDCCFCLFAPFFNSLSNVPLIELY